MFISRHACLGLGKESDNFDPDNNCNISTLSPVVLALLRTPGPCYWSHVQVGGQHVGVAGGHAALHPHQQTVLVNCVNLNRGR